MITEWTFIASVDQGELTEDVNKMIEDGWQPYGGVGITYRGGYGGGDGCHYAQAMVRIDIEDTIRAIAKAALNVDLEARP